MRLVLDANEYIFALSKPPSLFSKDLIDTLLDTGGHDVRIQRTIVREVSRRLPKPLHRTFYKLLEDLLEEDCSIDEDFLVPHHVAQHYQDVGFKEGDAHIAAYAEVIVADAVISENRRHFHAMAGRLPFKVMDAETFLKRHPGRR